MGPEEEKARWNASPRGLVLAGNVDRRSGRRDGPDGSRPGGSGGSTGPGTHCPRGARSAAGAAPGSGAKRQRGMQGASSMTLLPGDSRRQRVSTL